MNILFYVNPMIVRGDPYFYLGAIKNKLIPQARTLLSRGWKVEFLVSEFLVPATQSLLPDATVTALSQIEIISAVGTPNNLECEIYRDSDSLVGKNLAATVAAKVCATPDVIFAWETPANFLRSQFPEALLAHEMPGFMSRVPYPELMTLDFEGLFHESSFVQRQEQVRSWSGDARAAAAIASVRLEVLDFMAYRSPVTRKDLDPAGAYRKLILLPLQVSDQYAFKRDTDYQTQLSMLLDCAGKIPHDIGIVVTQYTAGAIADSALNESIYQTIKQAYPNVIWSKDFEKLDNISQYLLSQVDAVVTASSSIGIQALLWRKPLIVLGDTHLKPLATFDSITSYLAASHGECTAEWAERALEWMVCFQQPLLTMVNHDADFLARVIEAQLHKVDDTLINYFDISAEYGANWRDSYKIDRARAVVDKAFGARSPDRLYEKFRRQIDQTGPDVVSFDIFDTLLDRCVEQPAHVFKMMEQEVACITSGVVSNFLTVRVAAERECREKIKNDPQRDEITLDEIYKAIQARYEISDVACERVKELELQTEMQVLGPRQLGRLLYDHVKQKGLRVIAVSDMYLPHDFIQKLLEKSGYSDLDALYVSSSYGARKHEGRLFEVVREAERITYEKWFHIGDNAEGDVAVPKNYGIAPFHIPRAFQTISSNKYLGALVQADKRNRTLAESALYGLVQRRFFDHPNQSILDNTHFGGDPYMLGYAGFGLLMYGYLQWIMQSARHDGVDHLMFLSRDGKILWRMASILFPENEGWPKSSYVLASRRAARVASLTNRGDISALCDSSLSPASLMDVVKGKFGITLDARDQSYLETHGFKSISDVIHPVKDRERFRELMLALADRILDNAAKERETLSEYYRQQGIFKGCNAAVVDIGYAGTMQAAISKMTGVESLGGYYYMTFESALDNRFGTGFMRAYAGEYVKPGIHPHPICRNGFMYETLFCSPDDSFICFTQGDKQVPVAIYNVVEGDGIRKSRIARIHEGAMGLAYDLRRFFGQHMEKLSISDVTASRVLLDYLNNPSPVDAEIFEGMRFDDSFAATTPRFIVPTRQAILRNQSNVDRAIWKEGSAAFAAGPAVVRKAPASKSALDALKKVNASPGTSAPNGVDSGQSTSDAESEQGDTGKPHDGFIKGLESILISRALGPRKLAKYKRSREVFFDDSKSNIAKLYWDLVGSKT